MYVLNNKCGYGIVTSVGCAVKPLFFPSNVRLIANRSSGFCFMNSLHTSRPNKFSKKAKYTSTSPGSS